MVPASLGMKMEVEYFIVKMLATFRIQHGPFSSLKWQTQSQKATNSKIRKGESIVCKKILMLKARFLLLILLLPLLLPVHVHLDLLYHLLPALQVHSEALGWAPP